MEWNELFNKKVFITDLGASQTVTIDGVTMEMGQYGVFSPNKGRDGHQMIEVGSDCEALCRKYGVTPDRVCAVVSAED